MLLVFTIEEHETSCEPNFSIENISVLFIFDVFVIIRSIVLMAIQKQYFLKHVASGYL